MQYMCPRKAIRLQIKQFLPFSDSQQTSLQNLDYDSRDENSLHCCRGANQPIYTTPANRPIYTTPFPPKPKELHPLLLADETMCVVGSLHVMDSGSLFVFFESRPPLSNQINIKKVYSLVSRSLPIGYTPRQRYPKPSRSAKDEGKEERTYTGVVLVGDKLVIDGGFHSFMNPFLTLRIVAH
jgi:hypothetical protein